MPTTESCPTAEQFAAFYDGSLPTDTHLRIGRHLRNCLECLERSLAAGHFAPAPRQFPDPVGPFESIGTSAVAPPPADSPTLDTIGPYRLRRLIGRGGMGAVYEAEHERLGRAMAVKVLPRLAAVDPEYILRFEREVKAAGKLDHPNVVRATDAGESGGVPYLVMELVDGVDVTKLLRTHGPLAVADACEIGRQAASALAHAHEKGMVHRDVKPSNLMVTSGGVVKLLDLGLVVFVSVVGRADERITGPTVLGTQDYMAPEQWLQPADVTDRADVYGLGCLLFQLLAGRPPFDQDKYPAMADRKHAHVIVPPPDVRSVRPDCPTEVAEAIAAMLAKQPNQRPSAVLVGRVLGVYASGPHRLPRLVEQARLGSGTEFRDGGPTAVASPAQAADDATRPRLDSSPPHSLPPPPPVPPAPFQSHLLFVVVLAIIGGLLLGGLITIATGGLSR